MILITSSSGLFRHYVKLHFIIKYLECIRLVASHISHISIGNVKNIYNLLGLLPSIQGCDDESSLQNSFLHITNPSALLTSSLVRLTPDWSSQIFFQVPNGIQNVRNASTVPETL